MESRRGRPRDLSARKAILDAAHELLSQGGLGAVTMEAVAARAGVGKPTVYRWWPNSSAVAMAALMERVDSATLPARLKSPLASLRRQLHAVAEAFATPLGRSVASMLAASDAETELSKSFRNQFLLSRREEGRALLQRAMTSREIRSDVDVDATLDLLYGALFYRLITMPRSVDAGYTDRIVALLVAGIAAKS